MTEGILKHILLKKYICISIHRYVFLIGKSTETSERTTAITWTPFQYEYVIVPV